MVTPTRTEVRPPDPDEPSPGPSRSAGLPALLRNTWRGLTSMRTALVLLFLLALAALPGALLPQRSLNQRLVDQYLADHPQLGPLLDRVGLFDVFAAPWFAAIYLLLMVSLIGCVLPRTVEDATALRAPPVATPRNLARLPHHAVDTLDVDVDEAAERIDSLLGGWRRTAAVEGAGRARLGREGLPARVRQPGVPPQPDRRAARVRRRQAVRVRGPGHRVVRRRAVLQHRHPRLRLVPSRAARRRYRPDPVLRPGGRLRRRVPAERPGRELPG